VRNTVTRRDIEFNAEGVTLRGWFYKADSAADRAPVIVMAHGLSAVKEMYLDKYADEFASAGLNALVYDNRNFGASDGTPRQEIDPIAQHRDYRHAITYAQTLPEVDPAKIGIWGSSFSGGHVQVVAAYDKRVKAAVAQVPFVSGHGNVRALVRGDLIAGFREAFDADRAARYQGEEPAMVPAVDEDPMAAVVMPSADAWQWFSATHKDRAPAWRNAVTMRSVERIGEYEPRDVIWQISPTPFLMIIAQDDSVAPAYLAFQAYEKALEPKELVVIPGGHFDAYTGDGFVQSAGAARDFFVRTLLSK